MNLSGRGGCLATIEKFAELVPESLMEKPGRVFYSGRKAFESPRDIYLLGINSGGDPADATDRVKDNVESILNRPEMENWSRYREGANDFHKRLRRHFFKYLGLDPCEVPASNLVFLRSQSEQTLKTTAIRRLARKCWPFHKEVIRKLGVKVVVCLGKQNCGDLVRDFLKADSGPIDSFIEKNRRGYESLTFKNMYGLQVVQLTHPSRFWTSQASVPTELVKRALDRSDTNPG